jgi:hypothetical protein
MSDFVIFAVRKQDIPFVKAAIANYAMSMIQHLDEVPEPKQEALAEQPKAEATITLPKRRGRPPKAAKRGPGRPRKVQ